MSERSNPALQHFFVRANDIFLRDTESRPSILELGTRRWGNVATHHKSWFEPYDEKRYSYVMTDIAHGEDVDVVADAHALSKTFKPEFDAVIACSVFEHLERPWIAAQEILKVLRPGGHFFIQTHQTFPVHGYPSDYYRFSTDALKSLFVVAGAVGIVTNYEFPCTIMSDQFSSPVHGGYLNACITGTKP